LGHSSQEHWGSVINNCGGIMKIITIILATLLFVSTLGCQTSFTSTCCDICKVKSCNCHGKANNCVCHEENCVCQR